ncbi:MAG TPA: rhodanese-like domain-containing protein [Bryobacteraceae bacterium]|nr:rhodanese-like domain-containing protein [Bryobacteraceae bacterium]
MKLTLSSTVLAIFLLSQVLVSQSPADPWNAADLLEPAVLAKTLQSSMAKPPVVFAVAFPVLYNNKHLPRAIFAGPGSTAAGIEALKKAAVALSKDTDIVIYCGCCPMERCPNIRPAYSTLKQMGFTKVRVLHVPTNMATDWFEKGYPSEEGSALK